MLSIMLQKVLPVNLILFNEYYTGQENLAYLKKKKNTASFLL